MSRIDAPELEDHPAFPAPLRDAMTGFLRVGSEVLGMSAAAAPLVREALAAAGTERIVDLCSGGGGPVLGVVRRLEREGGARVTATLTDLYPNEAAFARAERSLPGRVTARREPTDATRVPAELRGVRTIFNAFHHLPPSIASAVLADAAQQRQPILTFEVVERSAQGWALVASLPAAVCGLIPFVRPLDLRALALTYAVPVVPAAVLWDGFASCLRAYSPAELEALVGPLQSDRYRFRIERRRIPWRPLWVTSVVGLPT